MPMPAADVPVSPEERHHLIDALRGFALACVLLANLGYLSLYTLTTESARAAMPTAGFDAVVFTLMEWLVNAKAITLFSLLFGLGFAMQLERAQARGADLGRFVHRLFWLMVMGVLHSYFLWWGDILMVYALVGLALVLFRRAPDGVLLWGGLFIALILPTLLAPWLGGALPGLPSRDEINAEALQAFRGGDWGRVFTMNVEMVNWTRLSGGILICFVLGRFLLGYWAGRRRLFQQPQAHVALFKKLFWGGLLIAAAGTAFQAAKTHLGWGAEITPRWVNGFLFRLDSLALGVAYAAGFTLLFLRPGGARMLRVLAPVGRMALTHYLCQSVLGIALFYGIGLGLGPSTGTIGWLLAWAGIFGAQVLFSHWWLARFRYGPFEWVWRSLTYGAMQPMRLPRAAAVAS